MATQVEQRSTIDPEKWLAIIQGWLPAEPREVGVDFINSVLKAAAAGNSVRRESLERLDGFIVHTDRTTRSGREKFETLLRDKWLNDPLDWPPRFERARPVSVLVKRIVDEASGPVDTSYVERKFRKFRDVPPTGLSQELKELANRDEIDRHKAGLYWRKGTTPKPYESQTQHLYRLVHDAPGHRMPNAELALTMNISRKDLETLLSQVRKRWGATRAYSRTRLATV